MVDFKTFCKIKYPNWLESSPVFILSRPNIDDLFNKHSSENIDLDLLTMLYKGVTLSSNLRK
jgi:hypothetical protein